MDEYSDFKDSDEGWKVFMFIVLLALLVYSSYNFGYASARNDFSTSIKYRCHQGSVHRSESDYWADTKQPCKTLEEIK